MITEEEMASIISLSISNKVVNYGDIKEFIFMENIENDEEVIYFTLYLVDKEQGDINTELAFTTPSGEIKVYQGSFLEIAETLFKATGTEFLLIGDTLIDTQEFDFEGIR